MNGTRRVTRFFLFKLFIGVSDLATFFSDFRGWIFSPRAMKTGTSFLQVTLRNSFLLVGFFSPTNTRTLSVRRPLFLSRLTSRGCPFPGRTFQLNSQESPTLQEAPPACPSHGVVSFSMSRRPVIRVPDLLTCGLHKSSPLTPRSFCSSCSFPLDRA